MIKPLLKAKRLVGSIVLALVMLGALAISGFTVTTLNNSADGFKLPQKAEAVFWPDQDFDVQEALTHFKESVEHYKSQGPLPKHPMFGKLTRKENDRLNCSHCALHLSFVHPDS